MQSRQCLHERLPESKWRTQHVIFPVLRQYFDYLGKCLHAPLDLDMNHKVDVVCADLRDPDARITVGVRCQPAKYACYRTSTFRRTEIDLYLDAGVPVPDLAVHAYIKDDNTLVSIAVIAGIDLREKIEWDKYPWISAEGQPARFKAIPWADYPHLFQVIEEAPLFIPRLDGLD
jgi:hypothetical protein